MNRVTCFDTVLNTIQSNYDLRSSDTDLCLPKPNSEFLKKTFRYSGAMQWNHLSCI
jgi:hypothetical protein